MKNQFVRMQPDQGQRPPQATPPNEWPPTEVQLDEIPTQQVPAAPTSTTPYPPKAMGKGLLSSWKAQNMQFPQTEETPATPRPPYGPPGRQQAGYHPSTSPLTPGNYQSQKAAPAQMSPYQAGSSAYPFSGSQAGTLSPLPQSPAHGQPGPMGPASFQAGASYPNGFSYPGQIGGPNTPGINGMPPVMTPPPSIQTPSGKRRKKRRFPIWARVVAAVLLVLISGGSALAWYYQANFANPVSNITGQQVVHFNKEGNTVAQAPATNTDILSGKRINILLLGSDTDGKNAAPLAQTDIVVTIDPQTKYVGMLSIPRDLQVNIPGSAPNKLDAAFALGWAYLHQGPTPFSNAAGLSIETIQENFGIPIDYYAWVGLDGFVKVIDTADGVDIDAIHPMVDDVYPDDVSNQSNNAYAYRRLYIAPGPQHMNGQQALQYVRTRHSDLVGDFGRSARQQQILSQLKTKLATPSIIDKLPELAQDLNGHVKTDMQLPDILKLMNFARTIDPNKIDRVILSTPYSHPLPNTSNLAPNCALITPVIAKMFDLGEKANCMPQTANAGNSALATTPPVTSSPVATAATGSSNDPGSAMSQAGQFAQVSTLSLSSGNGDIFGVHSLLDLMFMVVFESFDGAQV
ncbi:MAG TPA: LCP family protein [Ktedonobacteraceae bacterium]|nr:LCP family protein [Ktedonobacteraceae bacterium]